MHCALMSSVLLRAWFTSNCAAAQSDLERHSSMVPSKSLSSTNA